MSTPVKPPTKKSKKQPVEAVISAPPTGDAPDQDGRAPEDLVNRMGSAHGFGTPHQHARGHGREQRGLAYLPGSQLFEGRFGRMFRLNPYVPSEGRIREIAQMMTDSAPGDAAKDNPDIPAGYTYLGQFIDHDLTFDPVSNLTRQTDPDALTTFRSPAFDLDNVYGRGPSDDAFMYDNAPGRAGYLLIGRHDDEDDLPRNVQDTAIIGDPRNDENTFVSQLQLTMLKFHNAVMDMVLADPRMQHGSETVFEAAQRTVRWHYQWLVVHDFLKRTVGQALLSDVLDETGAVPRLRLEHYEAKSGKAFMPVEFSVAAYRFGHSQVRGRYKLNTTVPALPIFTKATTPGEDLRLKHFVGFRILPPFWTIEWNRFFDIDGPGGVQPQVTRAIDTAVVPPMIDLPPEIAADPSSIVMRNLTRGARLGLPSGRAVARKMGITPIGDELGLPGGGPAPLWFYILKEAELLAGGRHLGPVGGRIVAEVFLGLLALDPTSYLRNDPAWRPTLPAATSGEFTMVDLLNIAGHGLGTT
ncbi:heme peroxidase family protein [Nocardioides sp. CCNWLW239]|uniref:peroxidase family protein n=1 Tax=Nocardioides sp. CCNWLW239 TaxID=3128902 RepID=UPI00301B378E